MKVGKLVDGNEGTSQLVPGLGRIIVEGIYLSLQGCVSKIRNWPRFLSDIENLYMNELGLGELKNTIFLNLF